MVVDDDFAVFQPFHIKIHDIVRSAVIDHKIEHLVEVAIVERAVPSDGKGCPAHDIGKRGRVERMAKQVEIILEIIRLNQLLEVTPDREVGNAKKMVEMDAVFRQ